MFNLTIDAGHGGNDPGACGNNLKEKDINLNVALLLKKKLEPYKKEINLKLTRENDITLSLGQRVAISNNFKADLFVSIHCNSSTNKEAKGVETYAYKLSNSKGASLIHKELLNSKAYTKDRKVKEASYYVIKNTKAHAVLIELAFISNSEDANILKAKQNELADAILKGILNYFNIKYQNDNKTSQNSNSNVIEGELYRVCVGTFSRRENASKLIDDLASKGFSGAFIVKK